MSYLDLIPVLVFGEVNVGPQLGMGQGLTDQIVLQFGGQDAAVDHEAVDQLMKKIIRFINICKYDTTALQRPQCEGKKSCLSLDY